MATIQHEGAKQLLTLIGKAVKEHRLLTYTSAATDLGRNPKTHARAVAQMCDLLDAGSALAKVPLVALVTVRERDGRINRNAWIRDIPQGTRERIINKALRREYVREDFEKISRSLLELKGCGNRRAWKEVRKRFGASFVNELINPLGQKELLRDAIDDLDAEAVPTKKIVSATTQYFRDPVVRALVLDRAKGACEYCGKTGFKKPDGSRYIETHHIVSLAKQGPDCATNVIGVCAEHHREAHFGASRKKLEEAMLLRISMKRG